MRNNEGFTFVELMIVMTMLTIILGLVFFIFHQSAIFFHETDLTCYLMERGHFGLNALRKDIRETASDTVTSLALAGYDSNFTDSHAWAMATARHIGGDFHANDQDQYRADWQGVVVYCPYKTPGGIEQLRRYVSYGSYTFPLAFNDITATEISLDQGVTISRPDGVATNDPPYVVCASQIARAAFDKIDSGPGTYCNVMLKTEGRGRHDNVLSRESETNVYPRN